MNIINAPHPVLQDASFVIAFTGEGAAAYVVHGGWRAMLLRFAQETIDYTLTDLPDAAHVNAEEWQGHWMARFHDLDEWTGDESSQPYHFGSEVGEISRVSIYRLVQALPAASPPPQSAQLIEPKPISDEQLAARFTKIHRGPNPYYACNECGESIPGLRDLLVVHVSTHGVPVAGSGLMEGKDAARVLIERAQRQLRAWHAKYGEHQPQWLPPGSDVRWLEDAAAFLSQGQQTEQGSRNG